MDHSKGCSLLQVVFAVKSLTDVMGPSIALELNVFTRTAQNGGGIIQPQLCCTAHAHLPLDVRSTRLQRKYPA